MYVCPGFSVLCAAMKASLPLSATEVLQREKSRLKGTAHSLATKGASTCPPSAKTVMTSPMLGRGLKTSDSVVDLSEDVKPSMQKVCVCALCIS